jgi:uncharacterized membrane protein
MLWVNLIPILLIAAVLMALPALSRPTVPLGVSVPTTRLDEPVVHRCLRRYRIGVLACGVVVVLLVIGLGASAVADEAAPFVLLATAGAVFMWARRPILRAKQAGGWYDGLPVRMTARLTDEPRRVRVAWPGYVASVGVLAVGAIIGAALYDRQPDPYPTHWNASGTADSLAAKTVLTVFAPLAVLLGVALFMAAIATLAARLPERRYADGDPAGAEQRRVEVQAGVQSGLGLLTLLVTLGAVALQVVIWYGVDGAGLVAAGICFVLLVAAGVLILLLRFARAGSATAGSGTATVGVAAAQSPDDDSYWKAGLFYVNPDDPAIMVPKRLGIGWTINFGRPAGVICGVLTLLGVAVLIVIGLLQQHGT